jgi:predicted RNA-binding Zn-ribbon protein involved in translation (DUF1610 family)
MHALTQPARPTIQIQHLIERFPCPRCDGYLLITRIEPDAPGYQMRTFECSKCGHEAVLRATF